MVINMNTITTTIWPKIDIHSHIIYGVDDGSQSFDMTKDALKAIKKNNIKKIMCTPHFSAYKNYKTIAETFAFMKKGFKSHDIDLYLGFEFKLTYENINILKEYKIKTINNYLLVEFNRCENMSEEQAIDMINELFDIGYKVILVHPEYYINYQKISFIKKLRSNDVVIQIDATSVIKKCCDKKTYKFAHKLLKNNLVDIVASDYHDNNIRSYETFEDAFNLIKKKYGINRANDLFYENPKIILD